MNTQHIQHFLTAVRLGSLVRAAAALKVSQPALSKSIRRLEDEFGTKLFTRVARGLVPTEAARALLPHMEAMVGELSSARRKVALMHGGHIGHVTVAAGPSVARVLVAPAVAAFARSNPGVSIRLIEGSEARVSDALVRGEADFVVIAQFNPPADAIYGVERLLDDEILLYTNEPTLAARTRIPADRLVKLGFIAMESGDGLQDHIQRCVAAAGYSLPAPRITANSLALLTDLLSLPRVSVLLPSSFRAVALRGAEPSLKILEIADLRLSWPISIYGRAATVRSPAASAIVSELRQIAAQLRRRNTSLAAVAEAATPKRRSASRRHALCMTAPVPISTEEEKRA